MLIENFESTSNLLYKIKERNISISIDDFGTGYSCFSYLHRLPVDILKIDRSFVHNLELNGHNQLITESIIVLSKSIGMSVIAEGVEAVEQKNMVTTPRMFIWAGLFLFSSFTSPSRNDGFCKKVHIKSI